MSEIIQFEKNMSPVFGGQDFREYIGYYIKDVVSDEIDSNVKIILENKSKDKAEILLTDSTIDGENIFIIDRRNSDE